MYTANVKLVSSIMSHSVTSLKIKTKKKLTLLVI